MLTLIDVAFLWFISVDELKLLSVFAYFKCKDVLAHISCLFVIMIEVTDTTTACTNTNINNYN